MYNSEIKERFLSWYAATGTNENGLRKSFRDLADFEGSISKDIAEMNRVEAVVALNRLDILEQTTANTLLSEIKCYVKWCNTNGIFPYCEDSFVSVKSSDFDPSAHMAKAFFRDEHDFLYSMRKVREFDGLYNEVIALVFGWLGLSIDEAMSIHEDGVNFDERKIYARDGSILVPWFSDEFAEVLMLYKRTKSATRQNATTVYEVIKDLSYDGFIKRVCSANSDKLGTELPARQVVSAIEKMNRHYVSLGFPARFSMKNAQRCGGLHRLWKMEQSGVSIDNKQNSAIVEETYGSKQYRKIRWQYKYYKKAFNL